MCVYVLNKFIIPLLKLKVMLVNLFELIHCDIWIAYHVSSLSDAHYFLTIVDDKSRAMWVHLMRDKGEASKLVQKFVSLFKTNLIKM